MNMSNFIDNIFGAFKSGDELAVGGTIIGKNLEHLNTLETIVEKLHYLDQSGLNSAIDGGRAEVEKWLTFLKAEGEKAKGMTLEQIEKDTAGDPAKKARYTTLHGLSDAEWKKFSEPGANLYMLHIAGRKDFIREVKRDVIIGKDFSIDEIAKKYELDGTTNAADKACIEAMTSNMDAMLARRDQIFEEFVDTYATKGSELYAKDIFDPIYASGASQDEINQQISIAVERILKDQLNADSIPMGSNGKANSNFGAYIVGEIDSATLNARIEDAARARDAAAAKAKEAAEKLAAQEAAQKAQAAKPAIVRLKDSAIESVVETTKNLGTTLKRNKLIVGGVVLGGVGYGTLSLYNGANPEDNNEPQKQATATQAAPATNAPTLKFEPMIEIEDIDDAQDASKDNLKLSQNLMNSYNGLISQFDKKIADIDALISSTTSQDSITALTILRNQVQDMVTMIKPDPNTAIQEQHEIVQAHMQNFANSHAQIMGMKDTDSLLVATTALAKEQDSLNNVNVQISYLQDRLAKIDQYATMAATAPADFIKQPHINAVEQRRRAQFEQEEQQKIDNHIKNAHLGVTDVADALRKSADNVYVSKTLIQELEEYVAAAKKTGPNSTLQMIEDSIAYAAGNQAEIDKQNILKNELGQFATLAEEALTKAKEDLTKIEHIDAKIQTAPNANLANLDLAAQGAILQGTAQSLAKISAEADLLNKAISTGTTVAALRPQQPAASTSNTNTANTAANTAGNGNTGNGTPNNTANTGTGTAGTGNTGGVNTTGAKKDPNAAALPAEIVNANADANVLANYNGGEKNMATLTDGVTKVAHGIAPLAQAAEVTVNNMDKLIAEVSTLSNNLNSQGRNAEGAELQQMLISMRTARNTIATKSDEINASKDKAIKILEKMETYKSGEQDIQNAKAAADQMKVLHAEISGNAIAAKQSYEQVLERLAKNPLTSDILKEQLSVWERSPDDLLKLIGGGENGLWYQLFGSTHDGPGGAATVAGGYLSLAWKKVQDMHEGWNDYGRSLKDQSSRNLWNGANVALALIGTAIGLNLFDNTLGSAAGFQFTGWKRLVALAVVAGVALHGTGAKGDAMVAHNARRKDEHGNSTSTYPPTLSTMKPSAGLGQHTGNNVPDSASGDKQEVVGVMDPKTGTVIKFENVNIVEKDQKRFAGIDGMLNGHNTDAANDDIVNPAQGNTNLPNGFASTMVVPNFDTESANDAHYYQAAPKQAVGMRYS